LDKSTSTGGAKLSTSNAVRAVRKTGNVDSAQQAGSLTKDPSSSAVSGADASAMAREGTNAREATSTASETGKSATKSGSSSSDTFAALDADSSTESPTWIHAGAQRAEAGFQDPALGWVGIRANLSGGGVHAQLTTSSADAAQALSSQLTGLNDYLAEHRTPVETLTLRASDGGSAGWGSDQSAGQGMQQNAGQQSGQETASAAPQVSPYQSPTALTEPASQLLTGFGGNAQMAFPEGLHISVMA
jgi:flagellar hook-length control protein FliK